MKSEPTKTTGSEQRTKQVRPLVLTMLAKLLMGEADHLAREHVLSALLSRLREADDRARERTVETAHAHLLPRRSDERERLRDALCKELQRLGAAIEKHRQIFEEEGGES